MESAETRRNDEILRRLDDDDEDENVPVSRCSLGGVTYRKDAYSSIPTR